MKENIQPLPVDSLESRILTIRGQKVILDSDLAAIYGVTTKRLNEQVKRNAKRFPPDFVFRLTGAEAEMAQGSRSQSATLNPANNRSQIATGSQKHRDPRFLPFAFTENGAIMAANVLNSASAARMSVFVVRAFVRMRELLSSSLAAELKKLESKLTDRLDVHETVIVDVLRRIMQLLDPPPAPPVPDKSMGFHTTMKRSTRKTAPGRGS